MRGKPTENHPLVSIVIPHIGASGILYDCLESIARSTYRPVEILVVDNGSDLTVGWLERLEVPYRYLKNDRNLGFAGGCNVGIRQAQGKYVVLLNNDTRVDPNWLEPLVREMEQDEFLAACQPRLLSSRFLGKLDYSGAMGGLLDIFGYPFAIGRIFTAIELDENQYPQRYEIFWASGTASIWRKSLFTWIGYLDEDFFAHMEEIDLNWRCHLCGFHVRSVAESRVHHYSGYSLGQEDWQKMYLNHRNNLVMLLKNYEGNTLLWLYPLRLVMEISTAATALATFKGKRLMAVVLAQFYILLHVSEIYYKRRQIQSLRRVGDAVLFDRMLRGSVVWHYFVKRQSRVTQFMQIRAIKYDER